MQCIKAVQKKSIAVQCTWLWWASPPSAHFAPLITSYLSCAHWWSRWRLHWWGQWLLMMIGHFYRDGDDKTPHSSTWLIGMGLQESSQSTYLIQLYLLGFIFWCQKFTNCSYWWLFHALMKMQILFKNHLHLIILSGCVPFSALKPFILYNSFSAHNIVSG